MVTIFIKFKLLNLKLIKVIILACKKGKKRRNKLIIFGNM